MSIDDDLVAQMREFIARRHAGEVISQSDFQRRSMIGFVMSARVFERLEQDGLVQRAVRGGRWCWIKSR